tara:strand:+ start:447 stop:953 length:507 start_codon:yes stop_codon:yes gene_type:complete
MKVYKNFLPLMFFNKLNDIFNSNNFQWYFQNQTLTKDNKESKDDFMFTHNLYLNNQINSDWFNTFEPILYFISRDYKISQLLRMKLNLYTNQHKNINHTSHIDFEEKTKEDVKIGLLNFTNCNGGTKINKKIYKSNSNELIVFDNKKKHNGITQSDTPNRIILNIGWK